MVGKKGVDPKATTLIPSELVRVVDTTIVLETADEASMFVVDAVAVPEGKEVINQIAHVATSQTFDEECNRTDVMQGTKARKIACLVPINGLSPNTVMQSQTSNIGTIAVSKSRRSIPVIIMHLRNRGWPEL